MRQLFRHRIVGAGTLHFEKLPRAGPPTIRKGLDRGSRNNYFSPGPLQAGRWRTKGSSSCTPYYTIASAIE